MACTGKLNRVWIPSPSSKHSLQAAWKHTKNIISVFLVFFCLGITPGIGVQAEGPQGAGGVGTVAAGSGGSS